MRVHKIMFFVISVFFFCTSSHADEGIWAKDIQSLIEKSGVKKNQYGMEIRNVTGDRVYFSANANQPFNPASTMKMLISIAALEKLDPSHKFSTTVKKQGNDLCLVGGGDPSFVYEDLFLMVEKLLRNPSFEKTNLGNIVVDESFFPTTRNYADDFEGDEQRAFTAPLSSMSLNYNSVSVFVNPAQPGSKPFVSTEPRSNYFTIENHAQTVSKGGGNISIRTKPTGNQFAIEVTGLINANDRNIIQYRAVPDPAMYAGRIFQDLLERAGANVKGTVQKKNCAGGVPVLLQYESKPLSQITMGMNKFSNNFIAETLLIHYGNQPTSESGLENLNLWLKEKKFPMQNVVVQNSSGLSRSNSVTPDFLWHVISYSRNNPRISPEIFSSLPIGGLDGTLKRRFKSTALKGMVRAKSGSLKGAISLVGSINTQSQGELLFVFLFRLEGKTALEIQTLEENILEKIASLGKKAD